MLNNHLKVGLRNIFKYKIFSFINIFGIALSISVCLLIVTMLIDQKSYDQFHQHKDRIFRILSEDVNSPFPDATSPVPLAGTLKSSYPVVEEATSLIRGVGGDILYNERNLELRGFFTDPSFFNVFGFELQKGNKTTALLEPNSMVISLEVAQRLFQEEDPVGKVVKYYDRGLHYLGGNRKESPPVSWGSFRITGVMAEKYEKSHLKFDVLVSASSMNVLYTERKINNIAENWKNYYECFTYVLLKDKAGQQQLTSALNDIVRKKYAGFNELKSFKFIGQNLMHITPGRITGNPSRYSMPMIGYNIIGFLTFIVILIACFNYSSLSIARALTRSKEVGIRKVIGATRKTLIIQFLSESILITFFASIASLIFLAFLIPAFKGLWINTYLNFDLNYSGTLLFILIGITLVVGIAAGAFPAFYLSKLKPLSAIKNITNGRPKNSLIRGILSISQFTVSLFFISTSILIFNQFRHFVHFDYGFDSKGIVNCKIQGNDYQKIVNEFSSIPGVVQVSGCDILPATGEGTGTGLRAAGSQDEYKYLGRIQADANFVHNLNLELIAGKNLPIPTESSDNYILVNEAAIKELGYRFPSEVIGKVFESDYGKGKSEVVGVIKDFRFKLLFEQDKIAPLIISNTKEFMYANVKISSKNVGATISRLEEKWKNIDPVHQFRYAFYEDQLKATHSGIFDMVSILGFLAFLSIVIACLGLFGMAVYSVERRTKEIGIRKVLGAGSISLILNLSESFLKVLVVSVLIGAPSSYYLNQLWLNNIPNRVDFRLDIVFLSTAITFMLGLFTISSQTIRAALTDPVNSLRGDN